MKKRLLLLSATFLVSILGFAQNAKPVPTFSDMATDGTIQYLYNKDAGGFFVGANDWNTRASVGEYGIPVRMEQMKKGLAVGCIPQYGSRAGQWCYLSCEYEYYLYVDGVLEDYPGCDTWAVTKQDDGGYKFTNTNSAGVMSLPEYADGNTRIYMYDPSGEGNDPQSDIEGEYVQVKGNEIYLTNVNEYVACQMDVTLEEGDVLEDIDVTDRISLKAFSVDFSEVAGNDNTYRIVVYTSKNGASIIGNSGAILTLTITGKGENITISNAKFAKSDETGYMVGQKFGSDDEDGVFGDTWYFVSEADYKAYEEAIIASKTLTINVEEEGTLRSLILEKVSTLDDVLGLIVTGNLNGDDMSTIQECYNIRAIDMSETNLTEIWSYMFSGRSNLKSVKLPKGLKVIRYDAFNYCTALTSITFPATLQTIESEAFRYCNNLSEVTFNEGLQTIDWAAFYHTALTEVVLPSTLTYVYYPFPSCNNLKKITSYAIVPPYTDGNDVWAEHEDTATCTLFVPNMSVNSYKNDNGWNCFTNIEGFEYHIDTLYVEVAEVGTLGDEILRKVNNFTDVKALVVKGNLNTEDANRIKNSLTSLLYVDLSETTLEEIPYQMFYDRKNLLGVKLPKKLKTIDSYAFQGTTHLTNIVLPEGLTTINYEAFYHSGLESIVIPASVTNFGNYIFGYNLQLKEAVLSEGLTQIPYGTFADCYALEKMTIPSTMQSIYGNAFSSCRNLTSLILPEGLTFIDYYAFSNTGLKSMELPSTLTRIGYGIFNNCNSLKAVKSFALVPPANNNDWIWSSNNSTCDLYVPNMALIDYKLTGGWDAFTNIYGMDYIPNDINIANDFTLNVDSAFCAVDSLGNYIHKPNIWLLLNNQNTASGWTEYGALTVKGDENLKLSTGIFSMVSDPNYKRDNSWYVNNGTIKRTGTTLISNVPMRADSVTTRLYLASNMWHFLSFPYDVKVSDIIPVWPNDFVIRKYDGEARANAKMDETWVDMGPNDILEANQGYIWMISERKETYDNGDYRWWYYDAYEVPAIDNAQKNNLFTTGDVEIALAEYTTEFEHNRSWNLIGNPYPCYYDTRAMNFEAPFTIWNFDNQAYEAYSTTDDDYILDPNEAFFVQRPINQASIIFDKAGRQHTSEAAERDAEAKARNAEVSSRSVFNLTLSDGEKTDRTRVVLNEQAQMSYELDKDASKFNAASALVPQFFTINKDVRYAINERPFDNGTVRLGYTVVANGTYTIALNTKANTVVMLEDTETGELVNLTEGAYSFSATAGTNESRFLLHFGEEDATRIETIAVAETANGSELYTLDGRRVNGIATQGVYLVKKGQKFQKIFVK